MVGRIIGISIFSLLLSVLEFSRVILIYRQTTAKKERMRSIILKVAIVIIGVAAITVSILLGVLASEIVFIIDVAVVVVIHLVFHTVLSIIERYGCLKED